VIKTNYHESISLIHEEGHYTLTMHKDVSFLNKALLRNILSSIDENSTVTIDASKAKFIDADIQETLSDFLKTAPDDKIVVELFGIPGGVVLAKE
jgi:MFS superfamily sulfate permease-like transporter